MSDVATRLEEAEEAYQALVSGQLIAELRDQNGEVVRYGRPNITALRALIADLRRQADNPKPGSRGPLRGVF